MQNRDETRMTNMTEQEIKTFPTKAEAAETMSTTNQWMNFAEIKMIVAQRVANAIETIAIYETKTRMAHDSRDRVKRQEDKVAKNASDKRKWEGNLGESSSQ
ncbi:hypothetical protein Tco_1181874 [Tanacetum coccineum]